VKPTEPDVDDGRHNQHDQQPARTDNQRHEQTKVMNCRYLQATDNKTTTACSNSSSSSSSSSRSSSSSKSSSSSNTSSSISSSSSSTTHTPHTTVLRLFFRDHPGEPVPEENFWTLWCKGRLEADRPTIRLGAIPSGLTSAHLHHPPLVVVVVVVV